MGLLAGSISPVAAHAEGSGELESAPERNSSVDAEPAPATLLLPDAVRLALREGFRSQIAGLETDQAREAALETLGAYLPQLQIISQAGWSNRINEKMVAGDGRVYGLDNLGNDPWIDVFVQQALLDLPLWRRIQREKLGTKLAQIAEWEVRELVAYEVLRLYSNLARLESLRDKAVDQQQRLESLNERATRLFEAGRLVASEREAVDVAREQVALRVESLELQMATLRDELRVVLGDAKGAVRTVPESLPAATPVEFPEGVEVATLRTPAVQILDLRRQIGDASVSETEAMRWPTLVLRGGYANYGIKRFDEFQDAGYIFMGMEVPLFDGFQNHHAIGGAKKATEIARLRYRSGVASMRQGLVALNRELDVLARRAALAERQAASAAEQLAVADLNLDAERGSLDQALLARERRLLRETEAIELRFAKLEIWARLQRELGRLASALGAEATARP